MDIIYFVNISIKITHSSTYLTMNFNKFYIQCSNIYGHNTIYKTGEAEHTDIPKRKQLQNVWFTKKDKMTKEWYYPFGGTPGGIMALETRNYSAQVESNQ